MGYDNLLGIPLDQLGTVSTRTNYAKSYSTDVPKSAAYVNGVAPVGTDVSTNNVPAYLNPMVELNNQEGLFGLTNGYWNNLGQAAGLAGTTYGLYDSLLGNKADLFKEKIGMMKDQRAYNTEIMANKRKFKENIGGGFSNAFSGGLAASTAKVG